MEARSLHNTGNGCLLMSRASSSWYHCRHHRHSHGPSQPVGTGGDGGGAYKANGRTKGHTRKASGLILVFRCHCHDHYG